MNNRLIIALLVMLGISSCKDFIEPSLNSSTVELISPADSTEGNKYQVGFSWEPVANALRYRLQMANPDFLKPVSLVMDTLITRKTQLQLTLEPGKYQWRLRAENGSSETAYVYSSFTIHPTSLEEQKVTLKVPVNNLLTNIEQVSLSWDALFAAEGYRLQIDTLNFQNDEGVVFDQLLIGTAHVFSFPKDARYQWRVRAEGKEENSKWSETRILTYDHTPPAQPEVISPADGSALTAPVLLSWKATPTAKKYKLYVYRADGSTLYSSIFPVTLTATQYSFTEGQIGETLIWRLLAIDEAGNEGILTSPRSFSLQ